MTKYPTPDGAVDFLRLLNDHESDTVICMDPVQDIESVWEKQTHIAIKYLIGKRRGFFLFINMFNYLKQVKQLLS